MSFQSVKTPRETVIPKQNSSELLDLFRQLFARSGRVDFLKDNVEIVAFGSRSVGVAHSHSDLDVLCVGKTRFKLKTRELDLISISREECMTSTWLGSELGFHIAHFGTWLSGEPGWIHLSFPSKEAIIRKQERIVRLSENVSASWNRLQPAFRKRFCTSIRRELQRLKLLTEGFPVPPTSLLDLEWASGFPHKDDLLGMVNGEARMPMLRRLLSIQDFESRL
jgi:hypothetical protein